MEMYLQRKEYENMTNGKKGSKLQSHEVRVSRGGAEMLESYCEGLSKESAVRGDVRKSVKGSVRAEVRGVRNVRQSRVSPDKSELDTSNNFQLCHKSKKPLRHI